VIGSWTEWNMTKGQHATKTSLEDRVADDGALCGLVGSDAPGISAAIKFTSIYDDRLCREQMLIYIGPGKVDLLDHRSPMLPVFYLSLTADSSKMECFTLPSIVN